MGSVSGPEIHFVEVKLLTVLEAAFPTTEDRTRQVNLDSQALLKHIRHGRRDLQELATHVNSPFRKDLSGCPTVIMDLIAANAFVHAIDNNKSQCFVCLARPVDVPSALAVALEADIQERSHASQHQYRSQAFTEAPSMARNLAPARHRDPSSTLRYYHFNDVGHFARNYLRMSQSLKDSAIRAKFPSGNCNADHPRQDPA
ncbi:hypothetical protein HPB52_024805 [Rhipicephalus sanguineus]|uniref:Uncharacterized protein n=1 Tax=Rhipicephalus sanguineus TaxID=34632 RepID=A0A9D4TEC8_RHISA|nr:hypothetical protein HPB52_024805 [Rhipicephalus sanguineus]